MTTDHSLTVRLVQDPQSPEAIPAESYWLIIEQVLKEDKATAADVAEIVDALYDREPCVETVDTPALDKEAEPPPEEPPTEEKLMEVAESKLDLEECNRRKSGAYIATIKVSRSHPDIPYKLVLSVGEIVSSVIMRETTTKTVDVNKTSSVQMDQPIMDRPYASWQGPVYSYDNGPVEHPQISSVGNTLFWAGQNTGTIQTEYTTTYDLVTISVPGIPNYEGSPLGKSQDCNILAFYHYAVYTATVSPPPEDTSADAATLAEVCGWRKMDSEFPEEPDEEPIPPPAEGPTLGCIQWDNMLADPEYYEEKCCHPPSVGLPNCMLFVSAMPGRGMENSEMARLAATGTGHDGSTEFIAVGPGPDGCGRLFTKQVVDSEDCCEGVTPIEEDTEHTTTIIGSPGTALLVGIGGKSPYYWSTSGGYVFRANGKRTLTTYGYPPAALIETNPGATATCGDAYTRVTDGCSGVTFRTEQTSAASQPLLPENMIMAADSIYIVHLDNAEAGPFNWSAGGELSWEFDTTDGPNNTLISSAEFCGTANINVTDGCTNMAQAVVKSTEGTWVHQATPPEGWCTCEAGGGTTEISPLKYEAEGNGWKCIFDIGFAPSSWIAACYGGVGLYCGGADVMGVLENACTSHALINYSPGYSDSIFIYNGSCCVMKYGGIPWGGPPDPEPTHYDMYLNTFLAISKYKWECAA